ncbi:MAG: arginine repressor [Oscillospiraceae bacterium]|nr:arginine repressor [Oscillospiraceae bacterium]
MDSAPSKAERHSLIKQIVKDVRLDTQEGLVAELRGHGVVCTQATVSRDIKELRLTKIQFDDGKNYYAEPGGSEQPLVDRLLEAFSNGYLSSDFSGNIAVIKTVVGMAPACALAIDAVQWPEVVGTLAGDDTILVVTKSVSASKRFVKKIEGLHK